MLIFLKLAVSNWKNIALGIIFATLFYIVFAWWGSQVEINQLRTRLNAEITRADQLDSQVTSYQKMSAELQANIYTAEKSRELIVSSLSKEINKIRNQQVPRDCSGAVNYGIKYKEDMNWPASR